MSSPPGCPPPGRPPGCPAGRPPTYPPACPSVWWVVSDLHLNAEGADPRAVGERFPDFLADVVASDDRRQRHLLLLGDTFEVDDQGPGPAGVEHALGRLDALADRFPDVFSALGACADGGVHVHVVGGNHDVLLANPRVWRRFTGLLGAGASGGNRLRLHPWLVHEPGLLYAEHGHQHHELNRMPTMLEVAAGRDIEPTPLGALGHSLRRGEGLSAQARSVFRAALATRRAERSAAGAGYLQRLREQAADAALPPPTVRAVHRTSRFRADTALARTGRRVLARALGVPDHDSYLRAAAADIHRVLSLGGNAAYCYAFGHSHVAAVEPLAGGTAWYANAGTWSADDRGAPATGPRGYPYLEVSRDEHEKSARLRKWTPHATTGTRAGGLSRSPAA